MKAILEQKVEYKDYVFTGPYKRDPKNMGLLTADGTAMTAKQAHDIYKRDSDGRPVREFNGRYKAFYKVGRVTVAVIGKNNAEIHAELRKPHPDITEIVDVVPAAIPVPTPPPPLEFDLFVMKGPYMENSLAKVRYKVLHHGQGSGIAFTAEGETAEVFTQDKTAKYEIAKAYILNQEEEKAAAKAIVEG